MLAAAWSSVELVKAPFAWTYDFVSRHKRKLLITTAVTTTAVVGYGVYKFKPTIEDFYGKIQMMRNLEKEMTETKEYGRREQLRNKLTHPLHASDMLLLSFSKELKIELNKIFDLDAIRGQIKKSKDRGDMKKNARSERELALYHSLTVFGWSRAVSAVYITTLLNVLLKLQLTVASRYLLVDAQLAAERDVPEKSTTESEDGPIDEEAEQEAKVAKDELAAAAQAQLLFSTPESEHINKFFLSLTEHALSEGLHGLSERVLTAATRVLDKFDAKQPCTPDDMHGVLRDIRSSIENCFFVFETAQSEPVHRTSDGRTVSLSMSEERTSDVVFACNTCEAQAPLGGSFANFLFPSVEKASLAIDIDFTMSVDSKESVEPEPLTRMRTEDDHGLLRGRERLHAMVAELRHLLHSESVEKIFKESLDTVFGNLMAEVDRTNANKKLIVVSASIPVIKAHDMLLPTQSVLSPWMKQVSEHPALEKLCSLVYMPLEDTFALETLPERKPQDENAGLQQLLAEMGLDDAAMGPDGQIELDKIFAEMMKSDAPSS